MTSVTSKSGDSNMSSEENVTVSKSGDSNMSSEENMTGSQEVPFTKLLQSF